MATNILFNIDRYLEFFLYFLNIFLCYFYTVKTFEFIFVFQDSTFEYTETWGEQLTGVSTPLVFILDLKKSVFNKPSITPLTLPENMAFGQPSWSPDGSGIIGVSWLNLPKRLGLIYCPNRQGYIFHASLDGKFSE